MKQQIVQALAKGLAELGFRSRVNAVLTRRCAGVAYKVPLTGGLGDENLSLSEPWMTELLDALLHLCPGVFIDVGVNLGQTLIKLKCLDPQRKYLGFEPNPACVSYVNRLIAANAYSDARLIPAGLFDANTILELELYGGEVNSAASLVEGFRPAKSKESPAGENGNPPTKQFVPVVKFDEVRQRHDPGRIGLIKIDVEGAELEVVKSLCGALKADRPAVLLEVLPVYKAENAARLARQQSLQQVFSELGYRWLRICKSAENTFAGVQPIEEIGIHGDLQLCDYVVAPQESFAMISQALSTFESNSPSSAKMSAPTA